MPNFLHWWWPSDLGRSGQSEHVISPGHSHWFRMSFWPMKHERIFAGGIGERSLLALCQELRKRSFFVDCMHAQSLSCIWLCNLMDCNLPRSSVHGVFPSNPMKRILQARIPAWVAISSSRGSSQPRVGTCVSCIVRQILYPCIT